MSPLEPPDSLHLLAAQGWLELGNPTEAALELEKLSLPHRNHPDVRAIEWEIDRAAKRFERLFEHARALTQVRPSQSDSWVKLAQSFYWSGRYEEAYECSRGVVDQFPKDYVLHYDLACYACLLGKLDEAKIGLVRAFKLAPDPKRAKLYALEDPDLERIWPEIRGLG